MEFFSFAILGGAIVASLALGVGVARVLCRTAFAVVRMHATSVANSRIQKASLSS